MNNLNLEVKLLLNIYRMKVSLLVQHSSTRFVSARAKIRYNCSQLINLQMCLELNNKTCVAAIVKRCECHICEKVSQSDILALVCTVCIRRNVLYLQVVKYRCDATIHRISLIYPGGMVVTHHVCLSSFSSSLYVCNVHHEHLYL